MTHPILPELDPQTTASFSVRAVTRRLFASQRETIIASAAVLGFCLLLSALLFVLSWLAHNERYGVSFRDFLTMAI